MATERLREINELIQVLNQTREMATTDIQAAERDLPATERLLVTVIKFLDEVKEEISKAPTDNTVLLYEEAIKKVDDWARSELDRAAIRPKLLEERERTISSIVNFLSDRSQKYSSEVSSNQASVQKVLDDAWSDD